jgi:hypothetical protein
MCGKLLRFQVQIQLTFIIIRSARNPGCINHKTELGKEGPFLMTIRLSSFFPNPEWPKYPLLYAYTCQAGYTHELAVDTGKSVSPVLNIILLFQSDQILIFPSSSNLPLSAPISLDDLSPHSIKETKVKQGMMAHTQLLGRWR